MTTSDPPDDRQLWADAAAGDTYAFGALFDRHGQAVYNHCFRLSGNWSVAEDATANAFLAAWRRRGDVVLAKESALPWLLTVAANSVRDERRSLRRRLALIDRFGPAADTADHADAVAERLDDERRVAEVLKATRRLPRAEREATRSSSAGSRRMWYGSDSSWTDVRPPCPSSTARSSSRCSFPRTTS